MNRLIQLLRWDFTMQIRYGFWVAALFIVLPGVGILLSLSPEQSNYTLPAIIFLDISVAGTLFMAGVYFFEKREGSLGALAVTPVKTWQWLLSKVLVLTALGTIMCIGLAFLKKGPVNWPQVIIISVMINALFALFGFLCAAPFARFNDFFVLYAVFFGVMELPCLAFFGVYHPAYWALPTQPTLALLRGAFAGMPTSQFLLLLAIQVAWTAAAFVLCVHMFHRYVADRREA